MHIGRWPLAILIVLLLLASIASSEEKKEPPSKIGQNYDLFYAACDCRESA